MTTGAERLTELVELMVMFTAVDSPNAHRAREAFGLVNDLAADNARLSAILAALPEPIARLGNEQWCVMCNDRLVGDNTIAQHAANCPWLAVVNARGEAHR